MPSAPPALTRERRYGVVFLGEGRDWVHARADLPQGGLAAAFWLLYRLWLDATSRRVDPPPAVMAEALYGAAVRWVDETGQGRVSALQRAASGLLARFDEVLAAAAEDGLVRLVR
jgi:hypothetical protein